MPLQFANQRLQFFQTGRLKFSPCCICEPFTTSDTNNEWLYLQSGDGDPSYLTAGIDDPADAGWLRLCATTAMQGNAAVLNKLVPFNAGFRVEFDFAMWGGDVYNPTQEGADGICFVLFDADLVAPEDVIVGWRGGSLAYALGSTDGVNISDGFSHGWMGIGFDVFGNYASIGESKQGGLDPLGVVFAGFPHRVSIRGSGDGSMETRYNYRWIASSDQVTPGFYVAGDTRPAQNGSGYRHASIDIQRTSSRIFDVSVSITIGQGTPAEVLSETINTLSQREFQLPPENLGIAFTGTTGGFNLNAEIRNLKICRHEDV